MVCLSACQMTSGTPMPPPGKLSSPILTAKKKQCGTVECGTVSHPGMMLDAFKADLIKINSYSSSKSKVVRNEMSLQQPALPVSIEVLIFHVGYVQAGSP